MVIIEESSFSLQRNAEGRKTPDRALSAALAPWRKPMAIHDPDKVVTDLAMTLALGGDCLADVAVLRAQPGVFGSVASDPTVRARSTHSPRTRRVR